jgi:peptidylprolyl isomerase
MRRTRIAALVLTAALALVAAACGSSTPSAKGSSGSNGTTATSATTLPGTTVAAGPQSPIAAVSEPTAAGKTGTAPPPITVPTGAPPTVLESSDLIKGHGAAAKAGDELTVQYVLVNYATGQQVQSSWGGQPFSFKLGVGAVITGWDQGVVGMKVGGRRELVIPPALAYQSQAQSGIPANSTLVFVVDLLKIG